MNTKSIFKLSITAIFCATIFYACRKTYQAPPESADSKIPVTSTIKDLKARHKVSGAFDLINDSTVISGIVIANDKSGNLYKEIYIRDSTGAIAVELSGTLYTNFPVGKRIYIKCNGMCLSDYNNMIQLGVKTIINGSPTLESVPTPLIPNYIIGGSLGNFDLAQPKVVTQADLTLTGSYMQFPLLGDLIQLNGYEFQSGDIRKTYGDTSAYKKAGEVYIKNCSGGTPLLVRTSGYADFAAKNPQAGNGSISAIYTVYGTTKQLLIRDTTDVKFEGVRCSLFEEDFGGQPISSNCVNIPGWQNIKESGNNCYYISNLGAGGANIYAVLNGGYVKNSTVTTTTNIKSWLITPAINISSGILPKFSARTASNGSASSFQALISTNYDGVSQTPSSATWDTIATFPNMPNFNWTITSNVSLSAYTGKKVYIAIRYFTPAGSMEKDICTSEIDELKITKN